MIITIEDLRSKYPCNDPSHWIPEGWSGTLLDLYGMPNIEGENKVLIAIWFLTDEELLDFALWCAHQVGDQTTTAYATCRPRQAGVWMAAKRAESLGLSRESQVQYLIDLENSRGS